MDNMDRYMAPTMTKYTVRIETAFATSKISSDGCYTIEDFKIFNDAYEDFLDEEFHPLGDNEFEEL